MPRRQKLSFGHSEAEYWNPETSEIAAFALSPE
jgi:hypothetical protein